MKKLSLLIFFLILSCCVGFLSFNHGITKNPNNYYEVYLNNESLGIIKDKQELERYINSKSNSYKEKYKVDQIYAPTGLEIKKITTYHNKLTKVEDIYNKIAETEPFTIEGYRFSIKRKALIETEEETPNEITRLYVINTSIFDEAIESLYKTFVGTDLYNAYKENTQEVITTTGDKVENVFLNDEISIKKVKIPVSETIYTDVASLSKYLLFGTLDNQKKYTVKIGDTIEQVAFDNEISIEEFLISNPEFTSSKNLLFAGQQVTIGITDPKISVGVDIYSVNDIVNRHTTIVEYDETKIQGDDELVQEGVDGLERVTQQVRKINGQISYVNPVNKIELKPMISEMIIKGDKIVPSVGTLNDWFWPTNSGYRISSGFEHRTNPITGYRELHNGIDIAGTGMGSPVYASNNGVITEKSYRFDNGYYITINHNNGYYTMYCHMSRFANVKVGQVVAKGQIIGYIGMTGYATGPHLHFSVVKGGAPWRGGSFLNPMVLWK